MSVHGIHHASLLVRDLEASSTFYEKLLGLSPCERPGKPFDGRWYQAGEQQIHLIVSARAGTEADQDYPGTQRHIALMVGDLTGLRERLQAAGVSCTGSRSDRPVLFCHDPDGNVFELIGEG
jgi:glyoxylase I family protein